MPSYYQDVTGNLNMGDIAKSSDIHHIQRHIKDALKGLLSDFHDGESYILGNNEVYKNSFIIKAAPKELGRYIDSKNVFDIDDTKFFKINQYDVKQPIVKTKTSLYSIIAKFRNTSDYDIPIKCHIVDEDGVIQRSNTVVLAKNTPSANYEIVFDLDFYPTPPNLDFNDLINRDGKDIPPRTREDSFDEGYEEEHNEEGPDKLYFSAGVSKLYFVIERVGMNATDLAENGDEDKVFDAETSLGVYYQEGSVFPDKDMFAEVNGNKSVDNYVLTNGNIYYQDVYANATTYLCSGGRAVIGGEKVNCMDTHISVDGASTLGNVVTQIYLDNFGHLQSANKQASLTTNIDDFKEDLDDPMPPAYLPIALILTYSNAQYGTSKEPLIIQTSHGQLPRSHHERLRRLEKKIDWDEDIALPSRIKYTLSDDDWIDTSGESLIDLPHTKKENSKDVETLSNDNIFLTTDENGNIVVKLTDAVTQTIPVTLKEKLKDSDGTEIKLKETDVLNISSFSSLEHMVHDSKKGTLVLENEKSKNTTGIATTEKEAKLTEFNPWDDAKENRPTGTEYEKNEREYKVVSGKNGPSDNVSSYPGMTFYLDSDYTFKKLTVPIHKFKNCSSVKFYIWKRQNTNNKTNSVPYFKPQQMMYRGKDLSLKKAKEKDKYQYMDEGFTLDFGDSGLPLKKGQYVIVAVPTPKSGTGSLFVETYKPQNSRDICIKYVGAANASHFDLEEIYQEVWYNSASAIASQESYYKEGNVVSKTLTWTDKTLEKIKTVKPVVGEHLTLGNKDTDSYELYVSTGGKWIKVTPNKDNTINDGGARTFKWKLVFKGDGKSTPKLEFNEKDGYAIKFILTREKAASFIDLSTAADYDKNMCITSKDFDGDNILREYIGDMNFALTNSRFQGYEFARVWADNNLNDKLSMDIQASDKSNNYKLTDSKGEVYSGNVDLWSFHYCDLTLDDFSKINVDYSDYASEIEYDENNMRLKLDSAHSYNDNDIQILALKDFTKTPNNIDETTDDTLIFSNKETVTENQLFMKKTFESPIDLSKYTGLKFKFTLEGKKTTSTLLDGLGIYISSSEEREVPSDIKNKPENLYDTPLKDTAIIPAEIDPDVSSYSYYDGQLIEIIHEINSEKDGNKAYSTGYYQYIKHFDENKNKYIYKLEQVFDLRSYNIYKVSTIEYFDDNNEFEVRIELDQNSNNLKHVKEIGIISLNDENKFNVEEASIATKLSATCEHRGEIAVTLTDENDTPLTGKQIRVGNDIETTNNSGVFYKTDLTGEGEINFDFDGLVIETEDEKIIYSKSHLVVSYDFTEGGIGTPTNHTVSYDESTQSDYQKNTSLTISSPEDKKIKAVLKDGDGNVMKGKKVYCDSNSLTTNNNGEVTFTLSGKGTATIIYHAEVVTGSDEKTTLYKPSGKKVTYDFRTLAERITIEERESIYASEIKLTLSSVKAISEECLKIYDPKEAGDNTKLQLKVGPDISGVSIKPYNKIVLNSTTYAPLASDSDVPNIKKLTPNATQININQKNDSLKTGDKILCYINNPFKGGLSQYKHLGVQLATDVYIPKDCLKVNVCAGVDGTDPIASVTVPTMNNIYYPNVAGSKVNLSQILRKIDIDDTQIKSISITITSHFYNFINNIVSDEKPAINLFLGKIVLYRAETFPIYHNKMRFKFYSTTNGEIDHNGKQVSSDTISIRKIGAVLDYD